MLKADLGKELRQGMHHLVRVSQIDQCPLGHFELRQVNTEENFCQGVKVVILLLAKRLSGNIDE